MTSDDQDPLVRHTTSKAAIGESKPFSRNLPRLWKSTALAAGALFLGVAAAFLGGSE